MLLTGLRERHAFGVKTTRLTERLPKRKAQFSGEFRLAQAMHMNPGRTINQELL
jgi:hypothetical protein